MDKVNNISNLIRGSYFRFRKLKKIKSEILESLGILFIEV
jgi:hypothetical protein